MTKYLSLAALCAAALTACNKDFNDHFSGLDEKIEITDVQTLEYTLTAADYALLASNGSSSNKIVNGDPELQARATAAGAAKSFASQEDAREIIPYYLAWTGGRFFTLSDNSSIKVTYNARESADELIQEIGTIKEYTFSAADYVKAWGSDEKYVEALTPATIGKLAAALPTEGYEAGDYVAVSYQYADTEPVFGSTGDTDEEPVEYTSVLGSAKLGDTVTVTGCVTAVSSQGIVVADKGGAILLYQTTGYKVGDVVTLTGTIAAYNMGFQIAAADLSSIDKVGTAEAVYPTPVELTGALMDQILVREENAYQIFVKVTAKVEVSGNYYNFNVDGASAATGSFYGLTSEQKEQLADGTTVTFYGYLSSISKSGGAPKFVNVIPTHIGTEPVIGGYTSVLGSAALNDEVTINGYVAAASSQGIVVADNGGAILLYQTTGYAVGDEVTVSGKITAYNMGFQIEKANVASIEKTGTTTVKYPEAVELTGALMDQILVREENAYQIFVKVTAKVEVSGNYYNFHVDGASAATGSFYGLTSEQKEQLADGTTVTFYGYLSSISKSGGAPKFVNVIPTHIGTSPAAAALMTRAGIPTSADAKKYAICKYDGSKFSVVEMTIVQPADYTAMGNTYGSFTNPAQDEYLPRFLTAKYPYANADDTHYVAYRKYADGTTTWAVEQYAFNGSAWCKNDTVYTDQFAKANKVWRYNPSVVIWLNPIRNDAAVMAYYQAATDWVWENVDQPMGIETQGGGFVTSYGNNEYYTGCSAYYNNVDIRPGNARNQYAGASYQGAELVAAGVAYEGDAYADLSDAAVQELMLKRLQFVMGKVLGKLHADAQPITGMDVTYTVNVAVYSGSNVSTCTHALIYKVVGVGEFEFVEMVTL